jgi:hypothetical protein
MPKQQYIAGTAAKRLIARRTGLRLQPQAVVPVYCNVLEQEFYAEVPAIVGAEPGPAIGIRRQAVMDMHRLQTVATAESGQNMQEDDRIAATREADTEALARRRSGREKSRDPLREAIWGTVP